MTTSSDAWIVPDWPLPPGVKSLMTTRFGGVSQAPYDSFNLGDHVGDDPAAVAANRAKVCAKIGTVPVWLNQVHGTRVIDVADFSSATNIQPEADAAFSYKPDVACVVMTADCLPVLFCDAAGTVVAAAHAGWRGLLAGVLEKTVDAMDVPGENIMAYLGAAIGPDVFEVGDEVYGEFVKRDQSSLQAFSQSGPGKWFCDIYSLACQRLQSKGIQRIFGGGYCTLTDTQRFYSFRRNAITGRMASMIWKERSK